MNWVPLVFVIFKLTVFGIGMFFAIKWHYDRGLKDGGKPREMRSVLTAGGKVAAVFVLSLLALGLLTLFLAKTLGLDLGFTL